ncbi:fibroblast growth factor receptor 2-like [Aplysia californica]|uniref:Fibroblast growth factor receptor 2-like n=1 Tax=Aplysia californica TaxID=6500 RepID=A0ABM1W3F4_APLCA|nr:fibroblast growth factor receptor 2-like [Aplysia californica]
MSVEAIFDMSFSTASDVWSFGVVLFEIVTLGGTPYPTIPARELLKELQRGYRMERPDNCSEELYQMMLKCWHQHPDHRPTFSTLSQWLEDMMTDVSGAQYLDMQLNLQQSLYKVRTRQ